MEKLSTKNYSSGIENLCNLDKDFDIIVENYGIPPLRKFPPTFETIARFILEQQVSLISAKAVLSRLKKKVKILDADHFLLLKENDIEEIGITKRKFSYCKNLAEAIKNNSLNLNKLTFENAKNELTKIKGIGEWTANIYLLTVLNHPDVFPANDVALQNSFKKLKNLNSKPTSSELEKYSNMWKPNRSIAALLFWYYYKQSK